MEKEEWLDKLAELDKTQKLLYSYDVGRFILPFVEANPLKHDSRKLLKVIPNYLKHKATSKEITKAEKLAWENVKQAKNKITNKSAVFTIYNSIVQIKHESLIVLSHFAKGVFASYQPFEDIYRQIQSEIPFHYRYKTPDTLGLAKEICESEDFALMPILADALQDLECPDEQVNFVRNGKGLSNWILYHLYWKNFPPITRE